MHAIYDRTITRKNTINRYSKDYIYLPRGGMSLDEVAETMGISRMRVQQIEGAALRKLQHPALDEKWKAIQEIINAIHQNNDEHSFCQIQDDDYLDFENTSVMLQRLLAA